MWQKLRTIVLETAAAEAADIFEKTLHRFDEAFEGLQWLLARKPEMGLRSVGVDHVMFRLYVQAGDSLAGTPAIWVVYEITDDEIIIHDVKAVVRATDED